MPTYEYICPECGRIFDEVHERDTQLVAYCWEMGGPDDCDTIVHKNYSSIRMQGFVGRDGIGMGKSPVWDEFWGEGPRGGDPDLFSEQSTKAKLARAESKTRYEKES